MGLGAFAGGVAKGLQSEEEQRLKRLEEERKKQETEQRGRLLEQQTTLLNLAAEEQKREQEAKKSVADAYNEAYNFHMPRQVVRADDEGNPLPKVEIAPHIEYKAKIAAAEKAAQKALELGDMKLYSNYVALGSKARADAAGQAAAALAANPDDPTAAVNLFNAFPQGGTIVGHRVLRNAQGEPVYEIDRKFGDKVETRTLSFNEALSALQSMANPQEWMKTIVNYHLSNLNPLVQIEKQKVDAMQLRSTAAKEAVQAALMKAQAYSRMVDATIDDMRNKRGTGAPKIDEVISRALLNIYKTTTDPETGLPKQHPMQPFLTRIWNEATQRANKGMPIGVAIMEAEQAVQQQVQSAIDDLQKAYADAMAAAKSGRVIGANDETFARVFTSRMIDAINNSPALTKGDVPHLVNLAFGKDHEKLGKVRQALQTRIKATPPPREPALDDARKPSGKGKTAAAPSPADSNVPDLSVFFTEGVTE